MNTPSAFNQVARDVLDLFELQLQLLSVDSQEARQKAVRAIALMAAGATFAGSALTVALGGAGLLLHELSGWSMGGSLLAVAAAVFVLVAAMLYTALSAINAASAALSETKSEFVENLKWLKAVLVKPETSARNQIRSESFPTRTQSRSSVGAGS